MPKKKSPRKHPVRRDMTFRLGDRYEEFVDLVVKAGLVRPDGTPRSAEATRVLLLSSFLGHLPAPIRVAAAVHANATLILSGLLASVPYQLRQDLLEAVTERVDLSGSDLEAFLELVEDSHGPGRAPAERPDTARVHVVFDGWLYRDVRGWLRDTGQQDTASTAIRGRLLDTLDDGGDHVNVLGAYAVAVDRLRDQFAEAAQAGIAHIARQIRQDG